MEHDVDLSELQGPEAVEAQTLIASMISAQPERRISALQVIHLPLEFEPFRECILIVMQVYRHPFFWGPRIRLQFIRSLSDYLERYGFLFAFDCNAVHQRTIHPNYFCLSSRQ
jgi:hypothetical protein